MKNSSTVGLLLVLAAIYSTPAYALNPRCGFKPDAPDQHRVVRGDTLWGISGKFLDHPWCWPDVWGMNKEDIANPHWIYPGQVVYLDRANGRLRLGKPLDGSSGSRDKGPLQLSPQIRSEGMGKDAVTSIPSSVIEPFLSQPLIVEADELNSAARVVAAQEGRVFLGEGDRAYVRGDLKDGTSFQVFRPGVPLRDPESKKIIGYEADYLGTLKLEQLAKPGADVHTFSVASIKEEIGVGDRLLPAPPTPILNYMPHPPEKKVNAMIVSIYGGVSHAGQNQIVAINRGKAHGLDLGAVLELSRNGAVVEDRTATSKWYEMRLKKPTIKLPSEAYGSVFIFRTFKNISYGLVMQVRDSVQVGDYANSPE